jgi:hypothetical protein
VKIMLVACLRPGFGRYGQAAMLFEQCVVNTLRQQGMTGLTGITGCFLAVFVGRFCVG